MLDVKAGALPSNGNGDGRQHLVTLSSLEDDAMGEEIRVIWELEPGARISQVATLPEPTGFDDPALLDAFLNAVHWGAIASINDQALQAPFRSGIGIHDYQLDPVARAIQMPRANLLIADDVGLGKTIEAGLVVEELILRRRVRSVLIICPSALQIQWQDEMWSKFGLKFRIVDSNLMKELRRTAGLHVNPWSHFPRLITSVDFIKRPRPLRLFQDLLPVSGALSYRRKFDLLIVDEAHNAAPSGSGRYATDSHRTQALRELVNHFEHKLFLTATPHNGYPESFSALLEMVDNQRFARGVTPDPKQLATSMVRRLKKDIKRWDGQPQFPLRELLPIEVDYSRAERHVHELLRRYSRLRIENHADEAERFGTRVVLKLLKKRLFSSPEAFAGTLEKHRRTLATPARRPNRESALTMLKRQLEAREDDFVDETDEDEGLDPVETGSALFREIAPEENRLLDEMTSWAAGARVRADSKAGELIAWLEQHMVKAGQWTGERVIIFTEYRSTQSWLFQLLADRGWAKGHRIMLLFGGMETEEREKIKAAFQAPPSVSPVRILLATDSASEGIDLQRHCSRLIHYEIPWNPNRMEQRNGRIDRHGQKHTVRIFHFVPRGYASQQPTSPTGDSLDADLEFLWRLTQKIETIRAEIGSMSPVIASAVEEALVGEGARADPTISPVNGRGKDTLPKIEQDIQERVKALHEQLQRTKRELNISPETVEGAVHTGLRLAGQASLIPVDPAQARPDDGRLWPSGDARGLYWLPSFTGNWALCKTGTEDLFSHKERPVTFDHEFAETNFDIVLIHLNHPLVQRSLRLLRGQIWSGHGDRQLHRVTARELGDPSWADPIVVAHGRLVILGGDNSRLHEEIIVAGGGLHAGRFDALSQDELEDALADASDHPVGRAMQTDLAHAWPGHRDQLSSALHARAGAVTRSNEQRLRRRCDGELKKINTVMNELRGSIQAELADPHVQQSLFTDEVERQQLLRNIDSLRRRAEQIPAEIEVEESAIRKRFGNPTSRLFPVAVTYLVPPRLAGNAAS